MVKSGNITINGITDEDLIKMLEVKKRHEVDLTFDPRQLQPVMEGPNQQQQHQAGYNNAILGWKTEDGLKAVLEILEHLTRHPKP